MPNCLQEVSIYAHSAIQIFKTVETVQIVNLAHSSQEDYHPSSVIRHLSSVVCHLCPLSSDFRCLTPGFLLNAFQIRNLQSEILPSVVSPLPSACPELVEWPISPA